MKYLLVSVFIITASLTFISVQSCTKTAATDSVEADSDELVVDDSNDDSYELPAELEERAGGLAIKKVYATNAADSIASGTCEKYLPYSTSKGNRGYVLLKTGSGADGTSMTLEGVNFGKVQGTAIVEAEMPASTKTKPIAAVPCYVVSWDTAKVVIKLPKVSDTTKNISFVIRMKASSAADARKSAFSSKGLGVVSGYHYGQAKWDLVRNTATASKISGTPEAVHAGYTPAQNHLIVIGDNRWARVKLVVDKTSGTVGKPTYQVWKDVTLEERNSDCKGTLKMKKYKYQNGAFSYVESQVTKTLANVKYIQ